MDVFKEDTNDYARAIACYLPLILVRVRKEAEPAARSAIKGFWSGVSGLQFVATQGPPVMVYSSRSGGKVNFVATRQRFYDR